MKEILVYLKACQCLWFTDYQISILSPIFECHNLYSYDLPIFISFDQWISILAESKVLSPFFKKNIAKWVSGSSLQILIDLAQWQILIILYFFSLHVTESVFHDLSSSLWLIGLVVHGAESSLFLLHFPECLWQFTVHTPVPWHCSLAKPSVLLLNHG